MERLEVEHLDDAAGSFNMDLGGCSSSSPLALVASELDMGCGASPDGIDGVSIAFAIFVKPTTAGTAGTVLALK